MNFGDRNYMITSRTKALQAWMSIPSIKHRVASTLVAEIGPDVRRFDTSHKPTSGRQTRDRLLLRTTYEMAIFQHLSDDSPEPARFGVE